MGQRLTPSGQGPARRSRDSAARGGPRRRPAVARDQVSRDAADAGRSANRPAAARRVPVRRTNAPQPRRFTGRATVLLVVLVALALGYTYPVQLYLNQQSEIASREQALKEQRQRIDELSEQAALWQDDEYVKIQARRRFFMVEPGEVLMVVSDDPAGAARDAGVDPDAGKAAKRDPWYDTLWTSVEAANSSGPQS
ncbi:septum formation initiator family protein [Actinomycetes bacterium KLBMP 9797]